MEGDRTATVPFQPLRPGEVINGTIFELAIHPGVRRDKQSTKIHVVFSVVLCASVYLW